MENNRLSKTEDVAIRDLTTLLQEAPSRIWPVNENEAPPSYRFALGHETIQLGIVEFRKLMMGAARNLQKGVEPKSTSAAAKYAVRSGGWVAAPEKSLATVMLS